MKKVKRTAILIPSRGANTHLKFALNNQLPVHMLSVRLYSEYNSTYLDLSTDYI